MNAIDNSLFRFSHPFPENVVGQLRFRSNVRGFVHIETAVDLDRGRGTAVQALDTLHFVIVGGVPTSSGYRVAQRRLQTGN